MTARRNWTREEHLLAFHLYNRLPFGKLHQGRPEIRHLGALIDRTPASVALKLVNFARLDPALQARGILGMSHGARGEEEIWTEFSEDPETLAYEAEVNAARYEGRFLDVGRSRADEPDIPEGKTREGWVKQRVNQQFFRRRVLSAYDNRCCVTGLRIPGLLIASHIIPWAVDRTNRLNPRNGLCLNPFHDRAFDAHLMWIDSGMCIRFHQSLMEAAAEQWGESEWFLTFEGKRLQVPSRFSPDPLFLKRHAEEAGEIGTS